MSGAFIFFFIHSLLPYFSFLVILRRGVLVFTGHRAHQEREAGGGVVPRLPQGRHQLKDGRGVLLPWI